jgi:hypothetical protein
LSSFKALESSLKKEEEINNNACEKALNNVTKEAYVDCVTFLVNHDFSEKAAVEKTD